MEMAELKFDVLIADVDETNPPGMPGEQVPEFLAKKKADAVSHMVADATVISADTIVLLDDEIWASLKTQTMPKRYSQNCRAAYTALLQAFAFAKATKKRAFQW
jgi:predicted house-cleaning NTP pyrophosphatase (Maf/HAM1 superfamily)